MASPGELATRGLAILGSVIGSDWLGLGASALSVLREALQGTDAEIWQRHLKELARKGWKVAAEARDATAPAGAEPDRNACVAYVMKCVNTGISPTAEGLIAYPGVGLTDVTLRRSASEMESAVDAANQFLAMMVGNLLSDRTFRV